MGDLAVQAGYCAFGIHHPDLMSTGRVLTVHAQVYHFKARIILLKVDSRQAFVGAVKNSRSPIVA